MYQTLAGLVISLVLVANASQGKGDLLLVSLIGERKIVLFDTATQKTLASFPSPQGPHEITISPDGTRAYITDAGAGPNDPPGNSIIVLNLKKRVQLRTLKVCDQLHDIRVSRDGRRLWVACAPLKAVQEIDAETGKVYRTWKTDLEGGWFVEITPDDRKIYTPHLEGKALSVVDRTTGTTRMALSGTTQFGIAMAPNGREVWVSDAEKKELAIIDTATDEVIGVVSLGTKEKNQSGFARLRFIPNGSQVVAVAGSRFMVADAVGRNDGNRSCQPQRGSILWSLNLSYPGKVVAVSGDGQRAFVSHPGHDRISVINLVKRQVDSVIQVGKRPDGIAWIK